ncbi:MAG: hypothetical protein QXH42_05725 [Thermoplasmata archaeon]
MACRAEHPGRFPCCSGRWVVKVTVRAPARSCFHTDETATPMVCVTSQGATACNENLRASDSASNVIMCKNVATIGLRLRFLAPAVVMVLALAAGYVVVYSPGRRKER